MNDYKDFINGKRHRIQDSGFECNYMPEQAFPFQKEIIARSVKKGRMAIFADTGLGKTIIQLSIAKNVTNHTGGKVLIITPIAVGFQFLKDAEFIGIGDDVEISRDGSYSKTIVLCNYERLHKFESSDFKGVILDESSILKNFKGKTKSHITSFIKKVPYRFLSTATPSPNDFIELGTSSEVLGYMGYMDMIGRFFKSTDGSVDSGNRNIGVKFYLKPHAEDSFFDWVNQWSTMCRKPSDIGEFNDERYNLPELITNTHSVRSDNWITDNGQSLMFAEQARTMSEVRYEQKLTIDDRCKTAVKLAKGKTSVYWVNLNMESSIINKLDKDAVEITGAMSIEKKEDILKRFAEGDIKRIITKAKMTGMGLNWQHCNHCVFFPTWSYEQYYQAVRRFWRFGQTKDVNVDIVISEGQGRVTKALKEKAKKADMLYQRLTDSVNGVYQENLIKEEKLQLPMFK